MAGKTTRYAPSFLIGLLLVPLSAVAAFALWGSQVSEAETTGVEVNAAKLAQVQTAVVRHAEPVAATTTTIDPEKDLRKACGKDGKKLVKAEANETITDLEQAALDALRPICAEADMELPGPPAPPPVVRTVTVSNDNGTTSTSVGPDDGYDDHDDDYDDDYDDDHEDDDEYEDDDHEDDDEHEDHDEDDEHEGRS